MTIIGKSEAFYTLDADDGVEVRRAHDEVCVGYLPSRHADRDGVDTDDPAAVMATQGYRHVDEDGDVVPSSETCPSCSDDISGQGGWCATCDG